MNKNSDVLIFMDLETGGLDPFMNPILSIGACATTKKGNPVDIRNKQNLQKSNFTDKTATFYSLINPNPDLILSEEAMAINKIDINECKKYPNESIVLQHFMKWAQEISNCEEISFCNWALNFDLIFLYLAFARNNLKFPLPARKTYDIKTMALGAGYIFSNLSDMYQQAGVNDPNFKSFNAHNALEDAKAAAYIYKKIIKTLKTA